MIYDDSVNSGVYKDCTAVAVLCDSIRHCCNALLTADVILGDKYLKSSVETLGIIVNEIKYRVLYENIAPF